jgi:hypothetical protein
MKLRDLCILLLAALSLSCSSGDPLEFQGDPRPIFQGMFITLENSPEPIGKWGNPQNNSGKDFSLQAAMPNPAKSHTEFVYRLPGPTHVRIWATPAILPHELSLTTQGGAIVQAPLPMQQILISDEVHSAGMYTTRWSIDPALYPPGPYRVYMSADGKLSWVDVWVYTSSADAPPFLRMMFE